MKLDCIHCKRRMDVGLECCPNCGKGQQNTNSQFLPDAAQPYHSHVPSPLPLSWLQQINRLPSLFICTSVVVLCVLVALGFVGGLASLIASGMSRTGGYQGGAGFLILFLLIGIKYISGFGLVLALGIDLTRLFGTKVHKPSLRLHPYWPILALSLAVVTIIWLPVWNPFKAAGQWVTSTVQAIHYEYFATPAEKFRQERSEQSRLTYKQYLRQGMDINVRNRSGETPLMLAIKVKDYQLARKLIDQGADVGKEVRAGWCNDALCYLLVNRDTDENEKAEKIKLAFLLLDKKGSLSPAEVSVNLNAVAKTGNLELARRFLEYGGELNPKLSIAMGCSITPLLSAIMVGDERMAALLIQHGADVNLSSNCGLVPLIEAINGRYFKIVSLLLGHGAKVDVRNLNGEPAWVLAERNGFSPKMINMLRTTGRKHMR